MSLPRGQSSLADVRRRVAQRLSALAFLHESSRAFGLGEIPSGLVHGSFYVTIPQGVSLATWKVTDSNGFDWQSNVEVITAYRFAPHRSVADEDAALVWGHKILNHLVRQSDDWPVDLRIKGDDATVNVEPDSGGNFLLIRNGVIARHNLSLTEAA